MDEEMTLDRTTGERLQLVNQAIEEIMIAGQSYKLENRQLTRADLKQLMALRKELQGEAAAESSSGFLVNTYVAEFDGR